uniref:Uncharacterized protein n=1 Tax=Arion vulgaris TaxID=1028688 RepID=A0A0B6ZSA6_9EUPU
MAFTLVHYGVEHQQTLQQDINHKESKTLQDINHKHSKTLKNKTLQQDINHKHRLTTKACEYNKIKHTQQTIKYVGPKSE